MLAAKRQSIQTICTSAGVLAALLLLVGGLSACGEGTAIADVPASDEDGLKGGVPANSRRTPSPFCGDGSCAAPEGCDSCAADCGECPPSVTPPEPPPVTLNPGAFEFAAAAYRVDEGAGAVTLVINRVGGADGVATIDWRTSGVSATYSADYGDFTWTTLTFADGETSKLGSISIVDDGLVEGDEVFNVLLGNPGGGATLGATTSSAVTIADNDAETPPTDPTPEPEPEPTTGPLRVFPGAQGFGTTTAAGRGGQVLKVTTLADSGTGSLRAALDAAGPRIIVFEVGGTITLATDLRIANPFVTVAGQTAPSPGISLRGAGVRITTHDVLVQHLRIRVGDAATGPAPENRDAFQILGNSSGSTFNVVIDHVSASWAVDENASTWYPLHDVTISNSVIAEALHASIHPKGPHSKGLLIGDDSRNITLIGNLLAHNVERNPLLKGNVSAIVLNNLVYNGGHQFYDGIAINDDYASGPTDLSAVGNVFIAGVDTPANARAIYITANVPAGTRVYHRDSRLVGIPTLLLNYSSFDPVVGVPPIWDPALTVRASNEVEAAVLGNAGARPADRDAVDLRIVDEVMARTGAIIDSQSEVGGWPPSPATVRAFTTPANPNGDEDGDGYTNVEELLHQMAAAVEGR